MCGSPLKDADATAESDADSVVGMNAERPTAPRCSGSGGCSDGYSDENPTQAPSGKSDRPIYHSASQ
jgi:hypothetical protein